MEIRQTAQTLSILGLRELTAANAQAFREQACAALNPQIRTIEMDLSETMLVDSFGLGAIATLYKHAGEMNQDATVNFRLLNPRPAVQQVLELTRMHHLFEIVLRNGPEPVKDLQPSVITLRSP